MKKITVDIEPTWEQLCKMAELGRLPASELMPACKMADIVRQAQKKGKKAVTFTFVNGEVQVEVN